MSKLSSVLKKTGIAVAAAAMLVTMGAGTVVTQAKTSLPVYKVSLAKKYTNNQKGKQMEASVKIPKVKITGTDGKVMKSESEKLNAAISSYQNKFIKDYISADLEEQFYIYLDENKHIHVIVQTYVLAPYATGTIDVDLDKE